MLVAAHLRLQPPLVWGRVIRNRELERSASQHESATQLHTCGRRSSGYRPVLRGGAPRLCQLPAIGSQPFCYEYVVVLGGKEALVHLASQACCGRHEACVTAVLAARRQGSSNSGNGR